MGKNRASYMNAGPLRKEMNGFHRTKLASILSLFTSSGTLICCTLPALLVGIGAGAAMSSLVSTVPQLVWFSEHKVGVFLFAAVMLMLSGWMQWQAKSLPCPARSTAGRNLQGYA